MRRNDFFSVLAYCLTEYLLKNQYLATAVGFLKYHGALNTQVVTEQIHEAWEDSGDLKMLWPCV